MPWGPCLVETGRSWAEQASPGRRMAGGRSGACPVRVPPVVDCHLSLRIFVQRLSPHTTGLQKIPVLVGKKNRRARSPLSLLVEAAWA